MKEQQAIVDLIDTPGLAKQMDRAVGLLTDADPTAVDTPGGNGFVHLLQIGDIRERIEDIEGSHPVEHFVVLKGLLGSIRRAYDRLEGAIVLSSGMPVPIAKRPVNLWFRATLDSETEGINNLLRKSGFFLYEQLEDDRVEVQLDFGASERLDEVTWKDRERLPRIATIHPALGEDGVFVRELRERSFFQVEPARWSLHEVLRQLRSVAGMAEIAVLPELSLPRPDALEQALQASPERYPPLVVAGSAHVREVVFDDDGGFREIRANESRVYLDGRLVHSHRKIHPYEVRQMPDGSKLDHPLVEGITQEQKVLKLLSSDHTRLAVMICADVNDKKLSTLMQMAGVNLCLVPALTPDTGGFNGGIGGLASYCQGVSVIANVDASLFEGLDQPPFLAILAVPRPQIPEQTREYRRDVEGSCPCVGVFDPNERLGSSGNASPWR